MGDFSVTRLLRRPSLLRDLALLVLSSSACAAEPEVARPGSTAPEAIALQSVADALGIAPTGARVISSEFRDFPDASLGCPQPGMAYAQVITPGYRVLVEANGRRFDVRVAGTQGRICYLRKPASDQQTASLQPARESGEAARQDLALRLDVAAEAITVTGLRRLRPGETLAGCGEVCASGTAAAACGVGVRLRYGDRDFDYVALPAGVRPCPDIAPR